MAGSSVDIERKDFDAIIFAHKHELIAEGRAAKSAMLGMDLPEIQRNLVLLERKTSLWKAAYFGNEALNILKEPDSTK
jgi:hypothetical protein